MRALQSQRLTYILKGRAEGGRGDIQVFTAQGNVMVMKYQDTRMESFWLLATG